AVPRPDGARHAVALGARAGPDAAGVGLRGGDQRERRAAAAGHLADVDTHVRDVGGQRHGLARAAEVESAAREIDRASPAGQAPAISRLGYGGERRDLRPAVAEAEAAGVHLPALVARETPHRP